MAQHFALAAALFGASAVALTQASGSATVTNKCNFDVTLNNVPAANEGGEPYSTTLSPGDSYSQYYTGLSGWDDTTHKALHDGWSLKLAPASETSGEIIQFEYTYQPTVNSDLWFDMSFVNGDPFNDNWLFTSDDSACQDQLTHAAYMFPTDDKFGMQKPCDASNSVTLTLCPPNGWGSGGDAPSSVASSISSAFSSVASAFSSAATSVEAQVTSALGAAFAPASVATTLTTAPAPTSSAAPAFTPVAPAAVANHFGSSADISGPVQDSAVQGADFADKAVVAHNFAHTVTEVTTSWVTSFTTVDFPAPTEEVHKRHAHHAGHHHA